MFSVLCCPKRIFCPFKCYMVPLHLSVAWQTHPMQCWDLLRESKPGQANIRGYILLMAFLCSQHFSLLTAHVSNTGCFQIFSRLCAKITFLYASVCVRDGTSDYVFACGSPLRVNCNYFACLMWETYKFLCLCMCLCRCVYVLHYNNVWLFLVYSCLLVHLVGDL